MAGPPIDVSLGLMLARGRGLEAESGGYLPPPIVRFEPRRSRSRGLGRLFWASALILVFAAGLVSRIWLR